VLDDASAHCDLSEALRHRTAVLDRLRPDLAALSVVHPGPGAGALRIRHRHASRVRVLGAGRVGAAVATVLSAAGVGAVDVVDVGRVEPWDVGPAGFPAEQVGERRDAAGRGAVRRAAPGAARGHGRGGPGGVAEAGEGGTVTVVAPRDGLLAYAPDVAQARRLVASGVPHLYAGVLEGVGLVGPLVLPGRGACGECQALALADRDPAWLRVLAQLRSGGPSPVPACDVALATAVAGLAAAHVLAYLDGRVPPSAGARVELSLARLSTRVRALPADGRCGCGAAARTARTAPEDAPRSRGSVTGGAAPVQVPAPGAGISIRATPTPPARAAPPPRTVATPAPPADAGSGTVSGPGGTPPPGAGITVRATHAPPADAGSDDPPRAGGTPPRRTRVGTVATPARGGGVGVPVGGWTGSGVRARLGPATGYGAGAGGPRRLAGGGRDGAGGEG
jgi:bacteriocin biosynthesis cyclodehydratase domain-containing protein